MKPQYSIQIFYKRGSQRTEDEYAEMTIGFHCRCCSLHLYFYPFPYCVGSDLRLYARADGGSHWRFRFPEGRPEREEIENMKDEIAKIDHVQRVEYISPSGCSGWS